MQHNYLFLDIETTGLDPAKDEIIEIAWAVTDSRFEIIGSPETHLVEPDWSTFHDRLRENPVAEKMHGDSGLLHALRATENLKSLDEIYDALLRTVMTLHASAETELQIHLAGFSIHFDKSFLLEKDFHALFDQDSYSSPWIHHRMLDLSSYKLLQESAGIPQFPADNPQPHRALNDALEALSYARNAHRQIQEGVLL